MNINILSTEEIIHYVESGAVESIPSNIMLKIITEIQETQDTQQYDKGYDEGWDSAVRAMQQQLDRM